MKFLKIKVVNVTNIYCYHCCGNVTTLRYKEPLAGKFSEPKLPASMELTVWGFTF